MDVPNTRNVLIKRYIWQAFAEAFEKSTHRTELKGWLMPLTKFSSKNLKKENHIPIMFFMY